MIRSIRLEPEAEEELRQAARWYDQRRPGLGLGFMSAVDSAFRALEGQDAVGTSVPGVSANVAARRLLLRRFPYAVVFMEVGRTVRVLAIAHHHRRPGYWLGRLGR